MILHSSLAGLLKVGRSSRSASETRGFTGLALSCDPGLMFAMPNLQRVAIGHNWTVRDSFPQAGLLEKMFALCSFLDLSCLSNQYVRVACRHARM